MAISYKVVVVVIVKAASNDSEARHEHREIGRQKHPCPARHVPGKARLSCSVAHTAVRRFPLDSSKPSRQTGPCQGTGVQGVMHRLLHGEGVLALETEIITGRRPVRLFGTTPHTDPDTGPPTLAVALRMSCRAGNGRWVAPESPARVLVRMFCCMLRGRGKRDRPWPVPR